MIRIIYKRNFSILSSSNDPIAIKLQRRNRKLHTNVNDYMYSMYTAFVTTLMYAAILLNAMYSLLLDGSPTHVR